MLLILWVTDVSILIFTVSSRNKEIYKETVSVGLAISISIIIIIYRWKNTVISFSQTLNFPAKIEILSDVGLKFMNKSIHVRIMQNLSLRLIQILNINHVRSEFAEYSISILLL